MNPTSHNKMCRCLIVLNISVKTSSNVGVLAEAAKESVLHSGVVVIGKGGSQGGACQAPTQRHQMIDFRATPCDFANPALPNLTLIKLGSASTALARRRSRVPALGSPCLTRETFSPRQ